jgi:hypothetical protein
MLRIINILTLVFIALPATASINKYQFTAEIDSMFEHDAQLNTNTNVTQSALSGEFFSVGDLVKGEFSYDTNAALSPYDTNGISDGALFFDRAVTEFSFNVLSSGYHYQSTFGILSNISIYDNSHAISGWDAFSANSIAAYNPEIFRSAQVLMFDRTGTAINGFSIPDALSLSDFHYAKVNFAWLRRSDGDQFHFSGALTSLTPVSPVPAPPSASMLLTGLGLVIFWVRRRSRHLLQQQ